MLGSLGARLTAHQPDNSGDESTTDHQRRNKRGHDLEHEATPLSSRLTALNFYIMSKMVVSLIRPTVRYAPALQHAARSLNLCGFSRLSTLGADAVGDPGHQGLVVAEPVADERLVRVGAP